MKDKTNDIRRALLHTQGMIGQCRKDAKAINDASQKLEALYEGKRVKAEKKLVNMEGEERGIHEADYVAAVNDKVRSQKAYCLSKRTLLRIGGE